MDQTTSPERPGGLSPLKRALIALEEMEAKLQASQRSAREPIAVVGIGCRYPGAADSPEAFWRVLRDGVDTVKEVPRDRWDVNAFHDPNPDAAGKMYTRWTACLEQVDRFEPQLFGIAPRWGALAWAGLGGALLLGQLGPVLQLPRAVMNVSPYSHIPQLPAAAVTWTPLVVLVLIAGVLVAVGVAGFRRRDMGRH